MLKKLVVANRGEIAVRIHRAAHDLGIKTVQVYSSADAEGLAVKLANESIEIGPPIAKDSYLNIDGIIAAAQKHQADSIHPGYGFLAENATFAHRVTAAGMTFVGPTAEHIRLMGDKSAARKAAKSAGVPTVPGSEILHSESEVISVARDIGYPVMLKATAGGGGRGIRIANDESELIALFQQATMEAQSAFGDGGIYLEKVIAEARHIEVQILGDGQRVIHCFERECSLQRRRQKVWEESPAVDLPSEVRDAMCEAAIKLCASINYTGAGTIEYLYDQHNKEFYFIEMNTRIQVEHPVTEAITGIDLLATMLIIAGGEPLEISQAQVQPRGHAIEVRINAEDPSNQFMPFPGVVGDLQIPGGPGIRFDHMLYRGYQIPPYYDSLLGKLIVWGNDRATALRRLRRALSELSIEGLKTTKPLFCALVNEPAVIEGQVHTKWLEPWLDENQKQLINNN